MMAKGQAVAKTIEGSGGSRVVVRPLVALVLLALVAAGCGSVEQSLEAGSETSATTAAVTTTVATSTTTTAADVTTTTVATSTSTSTSTTTAAAVTTTFAEDSFIGRRTDSEDSYRVDVLLEDLLSIESLRFVSGAVIGVETGPTHSWETDPETGREDRIIVPFDSPEAMSQMLHIEIAPRHLAGPDLSEFGNTVMIGMPSSPGASASAVFDELSTLGDLAFFLIKSPVTDYRSDLWSELLDGEAIGLVEADRSVNFPSYAMRAVQIDNVDTFVEQELADAGFETRSTDLPETITSLAEKTTTKIADAPASSDLPAPPQIDSAMFTEGDDFSWLDGELDGYLMTYSQECGTFYRADLPITVWVEREGNRLQVDDPSAQVITITELLDVVIDRGSDQLLVQFVEGDIGQPERIIINNEDGTTDFCFELLDFVVLTADDGRLPVPLSSEAETESTESTSFGVATSTCGGDPTYSVTENPETITVFANARVPEGFGPNACLDFVVVELDAPIGDRSIVDGLTGVVLTLFTEEATAE